MIHIDEEKIFSTINEKKPRSVALDGPDGLLKKIQSCAHKLTGKYSIPVYVIGDTSWGSCDLNIHAAEILGVDILFNIGHTIVMEKFGDKVIMVDAYDDIDFGPIAKKSAIELKREILAKSLLSPIVNIYILSKKSRKFSRLLDMMFLSEEARDTSMTGRFLAVSSILLLTIKIKLMRTFSWDKACFILQVWQS